MLKNTLVVHSLLDAHYECFDKISLDTPIEAIVLKKIFQFNQFERDKWMKEQSIFIPDGSRVLDVGAGACPYRQFFSHCDYMTHDFKQLKEDCNFSQFRYGSIDYVSDIISIPVTDASFDVIICTEVLEHVPEPIKAINEFKRILRSGGTLLITAPLGSGLHQEPYHYYGGYTPHFYNKFLLEAGFENISVQANGGFFKCYGQESRRFSYKLLSWKSTDMEKMLLLFIWFVTLPWFQIVMPILCYFIDKYDRQKDFTVGYFVRAERR